MTEAQRRNLDSAMRLAARKIGWEGPTNQIPYAQNEAYVTELSRLIVANPARFDAQTLATARAELGDVPNATLAPYTLAEGAADFGGEVATQAGEVVGAVAQVGEGVKTALGMAKWMIPLVVVVVVALWLRGLARKTA